MGLRPALKAFEPNVLQCVTPLATYAHLALAEPIAHPGRGMPVLSSTVHIARHAFKAGPRRFFASFSCTSARCGCSPSFASGIQGSFLAAGHAKTVPPNSPIEGLACGSTPFVKIHDSLLLFTPTHLHGKIPNSTVLQGFAQWRIWRASVRGQWPWQRQHRPRDAVCARICNA